MGLNIFSSCEPRKPDIVVSITDVVARNPLPTVVSPNPDPHRFKITRLVQVNANVVALIEYDGCTTFEGVKLLVYANRTTQEILQATRLDPHFCEHEGHISPVARFEPTPRGWHLALSCAAGL